MIRVSRATQNIMNNITQEPGADFDSRKFLKDDNRYVKTHTFKMFILQKQ